MSLSKDICRFCLTEGCNFILIFGDTGKDRNLPQIINAIFRNEIMLDELNPDECKICDPCSHILIDFFQFVERVRQNQTTFERRSKVIYEVFISTDADVNGQQVPVKIELDLPRVTDTTIETEPIDVEPESDPNEHGEDGAASSESFSLDHQKKNVIDEQMPEHLRCRSRKAQSDAQIREFIKLNCELCENDELFKTFKALQEHYANAHQTRGYIVCCEKKIYRKDRILNHITNHVNPDAFKCPVCGQNSKSKVLLRIHMKQHLPTDERKFQCTKCPRRFVLKSQLTNHEASHMTEDQKQYICDECGKAFALKFVMIKHNQTHSKRRDFVCDICAKPFTTSTGLQTHRSQHSTEPKPRVQCNLCHLWYKNVETLRSHLRRHRDVRKHTCSQCGKVCSTRSSLASHVRYVHLRISQHSCGICQKNFRRKLELTEHMARHTGEILYRCSKCPKTFSSSSNYFSHRKARHPESLNTAKEE